MAVIQRGAWPGWPGGVVVELADEPAAALRAAVAAYSSDTGRHDADVAPIVMPVGGKRLPAWCAEMLQAFNIYKRRTAGDMTWALGIYAKYNMDKASNAPPALNGPHNSGYCADIAPSAFLNWMIANGARFGWRRTLVAENDLRHFQYFPGTATAAIGARPLGTSTSSAFSKEPKMFIVAMQSSTYRNGMWLIGPNYLHGFTADQWNTVGGWLQAAGVWVFTPPSDFAFDRLIESLTGNQFEFPFRGDNGLAGDATVTALVAAVKAAVGAPSASGGASDAQVEAAVRAVLAQMNLTVTLEGKAVPA